jgi:hypothetical protein
MVVKTQNLLIARAERAPKEQTEQNRKSVEIAHRKTTHKTKEYWWFSSILGKNVLWLAPDADSAGQKSSNPQKNGIRLCYTLFSKIRD